MKIKNSLRFRLFIIFSAFLIAFVCLLTFIQFSIVGRFYATSEYVQQREKELYSLIFKFVADNTYFDNNYNGEPVTKYEIQGIEHFENTNNVNILILDSNMKSKYITNKTLEEIKPDYISYIQDKVPVETFKAVPDAPISFRVYGKYGIPSKYIAIVFQNYNNTKNAYYIVAIIPEVLTKQTSNILRSYMRYIVLFSLLIAFALSGLFSYIVTKPIVEMNKSASRMTKMDLSAKCKIKRTDEIGNLANTLNYLSSSLESTLKKLYDANDKLKEDLDLQKELDMMQKDFIAAITHDFKTPITLIRGYSESIKDNVAEGEDREFAIDTIINETEKLDKLVNDLLDLSTLESVNYKLNISNFSINDLIWDIAKKYERVMKANKIVFRTETMEDNLYVEGDPFRIEQVITNFLNNAIDYTPHGNRITLSLKTKGNNVLVSVENQGSQIKDDELKRIWEKFYRIEKSRTREYGGTGLGLAIASAILRLHNSDYGAENTYDGVRFYFTLPIFKERLQL